MKEGKEAAEGAEKPMRSKALKRGETFELDIDVGSCRDQNRGWRDRLRRG